MSRFRYSDWHDEDELWRRIEDRLGEDPSMADAFNVHVQSQPDNVFLRFNGDPLTWRETKSRINAIANGLADLGVDKGDRVALHSGHDPDYIATQFALYSLGAAPVPIHAPLASAPHEFEYIVTDSGADVVIAQNELAGVLEGVDDDAYETAISLGETDVDVDYTIDEIATAGEDWLGNSVGSLDDVCMHYYTSGTTGKPKGVIHTNASMLAQAHQMSVAMNYSDDERVQCHYLPTHVGNPGFELSAIYSGGGLNQMWPFEPEKAVDYLIDEEATTLAVVPTHVIKMLQHGGMKDHDLESLDLIAYGGAPMPFPRIKEIKDRWAEIDLQNIYGMTETAGAITYMRDEHALEKQGGAGGPCPGVEIDVLDLNGDSVDVGETGEVVANAPNAMQEYWNRPEKTADVLQDGWYYTGDIGHFDEDGILFIDGRKDHMIIRGGENLYPPEIEDALTDHEDVAEAAVVGVPDDEYGERAKAFIVPVEGSDPDPQEIVDSCRDALATYKLPEIIEFVDDLPRTAMEKIDKMELTDQHGTENEYRTWEHRD